MAQQSLQRAALSPLSNMLSRAGSLVGADPLWACSPAQILWLSAAKATLSSLGKLGACIPNYLFIACDERPWPMAAENFLALSGPIPADCFAGSASCRHSWGDLHLGSARHCAADAIHFHALAAALGSAGWARIAACSHEWAHAWQAMTGHAFARSAALASGSALASSFLESLPRGEFPLGNLGLPYTARRHGTCALLAEEAFCDAVSIWLLSSMGLDAPCGKFRAFRKARQAVGQNPTHCTSAILGNFFPRDIRQLGTFEAFLSHASSVGALAASQAFGTPAPTH